MTEGEFAVSYQTAGGWTATSKDFFTEVLGAGQNVEIQGLPRSAAQSLTLLLLNLAATSDPVESGETL
jgi:hypothetical protein